MQLKQITNFIESVAPLAFQESYDNAGLIIGNPEDEISGILITLDITEEILDEAISKKLNLIVCHHPIVFSGIKKLNGKNYIERCVAKAIRNDIEAMINSMTLEERADPDLINMSRKKRIAKGAGKDITEVNAFMKQFEQMRDMMKGMNKAGMFGKAMQGMKR